MNTGFDVSRRGIFWNLRNDAAAAVNVAIVAIPTAIGVGLITTLSLGADYSGVGALAGLIGLIAATLIPPFTGTSHYQFSTPGPAAAGILGGLAATVAGLAGNDSPAEAAKLALNAVFMCALLVGLFHILIGQLRLGNLIKLVPQTVITGIMNGILVLVAFYQLPWLLGLDQSISVTHLAAAASQANMLDLMVGLSAIAGVYLSRWVGRLVPPLLFGMVTGTLVYWGIRHFSGAALGPTIGLLPTGLPTPERLLGIVDLAQSPALAVLGPHILIAAIAITLVTGIGALVTATVADSITNNRHSPRGELTGLGIGNMVAAAFSGVPSGGSPTSVLLNYQSGGRTRMSHVITSLIFLACILGIGPVIAVIPLSVIAGVLIVISIRTFDTWPILLARKILRSHDSQIRRNLVFNLFLICAVMLLIVFKDLMTALLAGLVLQLLNFLLGSGAALVRQKFSGDALRSNVVRNQHALALLSEKTDSVQVVMLQGTLFFGNTDYLENYIEQISSDVMVIILDCGRIVDIDSSGVLVLSRIDKRFAANGKSLFFTGLKHAGELLVLMKEYGFLAPVTDGRVFEDLNAGLAHAEDMILKSNGYTLDPAQEMELSITVPFKGLSASELKRLQLRRVEYATGDVIIKQGAEADGLHVLVSGRVIVQKHETPSSKPISLVEFGAGVNLGEMGILGNVARTADVIAKEPSVLYFMTRNAFDLMRADDPALAVKILVNISGSLSRRLAEASRTIAEFQSY